MKGVIVNCLGELVKEKFGKEKWEDVLTRTGMDSKTHILAVRDIDDAVVMKLLKSVCDVLDISMIQAADAFGDYWVNDYAPKIYKTYYKDVDSAKDFLLKMDDVHSVVSGDLADAKPPRFGYDWEDDKTLIMTYMSERSLIDIMVGLIKGVGRYFDEDLVITKLGNEKVRITFP